ncbi:MAG TPA: IS3 family transposase, partial [Gemmatimonadales bacterium]
VSRGRARSRVAPGRRLGGGREQSFFATVKTELIPDTMWPSRRDGIEALRQYLAWYNGQRRHSTLDYLSPAAFEAQLTAA